MLELVVGFPVSLPTVSRVAFAQQVYAANLGAVKNLAKTSLISQQSLNLVVVGRSGIARAASGRFFIVRAIVAARPAQVSRAVKALVGSAVHEVGQSAGSGV